MRVFQWLPAIAFLTISPGLSVVVGAAPITFNTALPVAEDEFIFREQVRWLRSSDDPSDLDREVDIVAAISVLGYGVSGKLAVFGVLPYVDKNLKIRAYREKIKRDNQGLGDASVFARYTFWRDDVKGRTFRLAGFGGFKAPTGDDDENDRFGRLPPPLQNGSGSWDWFGGMVATYQTLGYQLDGQLGYRINREANGFEAGDELRLDLSGQYRLWPRVLGGGVPGFFYAVLEVNVLYQEKSRIEGHKNPNSGGTTVWLSPGLQYVTRRWVLEAVMQKPVSQDLNGSALQNDWIATASFRMNF